MGEPYAANGRTRRCGQVRNEAGIAERQRCEWPDPSKNSPNGMFW